MLRKKSKISTQLRCHNVTSAKILPRTDFCGPQGVTEIRDRNGWFDKVTTISYNEHGDRTAQRETMTRNSAAPDVVAYSVDENGTITPERRTTEPTESPGPDLRDLAGENQVRYEYEYDGYGNWTQQTENHSYGSDSPSNVRHRKLTYY